MSLLLVRLDGALMKREEGVVVLFIKVHLQKRCI